MYEILTVIFTIILLSSIFATIKYGFNIVFFYIGLFSLLIIAWGIIAILGEKKK